MNNIAVDKRDQTKGLLSRLLAVTGKSIEDIGYNNFDQEQLMGEMVRAPASVDYCHLSFDTDGLPLGLHGMMAGFVANLDDGKTPFLSTVGTENVSQNSKSEAPGSELSLFSTPLRIFALISIRGLASNLPGSNNAASEPAIPTDFLD